VGVNTTLDSTGQKDSDELEEEEDYQHDPNYEADPLENALEAFPAICATRVVLGAFVCLSVAAGIFGRGRNSADALSIKATQWMEELNISLAHPVSIVFNIHPSETVLVCGWCVRYRFHPGYNKYQQVGTVSSNQTCWIQQQ